MTTYRERREARAERLREWAEKREQRSAAELERARLLADTIPFGQPILVGHHSEKRHRRDLDRIDAEMRRGVESARKAESMASRAAGIDDQLATSIYSDDPDALDQLAEKVARLEAERDRIKAYNASCRKAAKTGGTGDLALLDDRQRADSASLARTSAYQVGPGGAFPAYALSNLSGTIKRTRDRIAEVQARQAKQQRTEAAGGTLVETVGGGRYARVTFAEKPDRDVIGALKAAGFRWGAGSWTGDVDALPAEVRS